MKSTNRALNRVLLLVVGLVLLIVGLAIVVLGSWPDAAGLRDTITGVIRSTPESLTAWQADLSAIDLGTLPWLVIIAPIAALVVTVLLVVFIAAQGRGRAAQVVHLRSTAGATDVDTGVADAIIGEALSACREIGGSKVRAFRVRRQPALEVVVIARRGVDIGRLTDRATEAIEVWDGFLGREVPVLLHLTTGNWSGLRRPNRVQ